jgi:hypothetical protein
MEIVSDKSCTITDKNILSLNLGPFDSSIPDEIFGTIQVPISKLDMYCTTTKGKLVHIFTICPECGKKSCNHEQPEMATSNQLCIRDENDEPFGYIKSAHIYVNTENKYTASIIQYAIEDGHIPLDENGEPKVRNI